MRQLDLFNSFFDTPPPQENKPEEKPVVTKEEEAGSNVAETVAPSYSKNALRSERLVAEQVIIATTPSQTEQEHETSTADNVPSSPLLLSSFDAPFSTKEPEASTQAIEVSIETATEAQVVEEPTERISSTELLDAVIADEPEVLIVESQLETSSVPAVSVPAPEVMKKVEVSNQKKQNTPELQRNGAVIFDDGKITVKIKNKSAFPAPDADEEKEKAKKLLQKRGRKSFKEIDADADLIEIPEDEILFQKQYYPISEVAKWFRVNTSLLRFWENEFDVLKPRKNRKGDRLFRPEDVKNLQLIYQLLRERKYTIEGAKEYIKTNKKKADIQLHLTNTLHKFKSFLLDLKANLQ